VNERICVLRESAFPGDSHLRRNVDALVDAGYEVDVICLCEPGELLSEAYRGGAIVRLPVRHRRGGRLRYCFEYTAFFLMALLVLTARHLWRGYRTVEVYNLPDVLVLAAWPAKFLGARIVFSMFEVMPEQAAEQLGLEAEHWFIRMLRFFQRLAVRSSDAVVVVSPYDAALIEPLRPRRQPLVLLNVPASPLFRPLPSRGEDGRFVILTHGSILPRYGIETAIDALPAILKTAPEVRLRILGEGEQRPALEARVAAFGIQEAVEFTGLRPYSEVPAAIATADLCIVPAAVPWLLPNKLFEYAAMCRPVLSSRSPSVEGVFGEAVAYFEPGDADDFTRRVLELRADAGDRERLAWAGHAIYQRHQWSTAKRSYLALHAELARTSESETADETV
jgi:glycosyltransferase involved in cell wall biosynthesis